jgi:hypothetical protein
LVLCIAHKHLRFVTAPHIWHIGLTGQTYLLNLHDKCSLQTYLKISITYTYTTTKTVKLDAYFITYTYTMTSHLTSHFFVYHGRVGAKLI